MEALFSQQPFWQEWGLVVLVQIGIIAGLVGLLIPVFPGLLVIWAAILVYGFVVGFTWWSVALMVLITVIGIAASLADNLLMAGGARSGGASWGSIIVAVLAGIAGTLLLPPFGGLIAAPLAVLLLEYIRLGDMKKARAALAGMLKGYGIAFVLRLMGGLLMMVLWWGWVILER